MRDCTYIAADFDHDKAAVDRIMELNALGYINIKSAHDLQQSRDSSLACSIKQSLKSRMDNSKQFILIVGDQTNTVTKGGCQLCQSYNSYTSHCARGGNVDTRSFIKYECDKAVEASIKIVVLYFSLDVDHDLCPEAVRWKGIHKRMIFRGNDGQLYWDNQGIADAINA